MVAQESIGTVQAISGKVSATGANGETRELHEGDALYLGDTVSTGTNSAVVFEFADGLRKGMASDSTTTLDEKFAGLSESSDTEPAVTAPATAETSEPQAGSQPVEQGAQVGTVSSASGEATATSPDGSSRELANGEPLFAGDILETGANGLVVIELADGTRKGLSSSSRLTLENITLAAPVLAQSSAVADEPAVQSVQAQVAKGAVAQVEAVDDDVAALQAAIEEGADPSQEAEATAAGGEAGADGGHDAVFLARSGQATTPDSGYDTVGIGFAALPGLLEVDPQSPEFGGPNTPPLLFHTLVQHVKEVLDLVLDLVEDLLESVADLIREILDLVETFLNDLNISNLVDGLIDAIQNVANDVVDALLEAVVRAIDLVGGGADDHGHIGDGVADNATTLFIAFWAADDTLDRLEQIGIDILGLDPRMDSGYEDLKAEVNGRYDQLADAVKDNIIEGIRDLQDATIAENDSSLVDAAQAGVMDGDSEYNEGGQYPGVRGIENAADEGGFDQVKDGVTAQTGSEGMNIGGRASIVGNAVADEIYSDEDGSGVVGDLRGPRDGDSTEAADGTILGESYDVVDEVADAADTIWTGEKYENGEYQKHGDGVVVDAGLAVRNGIEEQNPGRAADATKSLAVAAGDLEQVGQEASDLDPAIRQYAETNVEGVENIGGAVEEALTPSASSSSSNSGGPNLQDLADAGAVPVSQSSSPALAINSGTAGVSQPVSVTLMNDGIAEIVLTQNDAVDGVFELHDPSAALIQIDGFTSDSMLDISDLMREQNYDPAESDLSHYLQVAGDEDGNTILSIGTDESGTFEPAQQIVLSGVNQSSGAGLSELLSHIDVGGAGGASSLLAMSDTPTELI